MDLSCDINALRIEMSKKSRHRDSRINSFSKKMPIRWEPHNIINPKTDFAFSDDSAWDLIANLLEDLEYPIKVIVLDKPPGMEAIVIMHVLVPTQPELYIKVHMGHQKVIGRSFHISTR
jgi:hypothetical protein